MAVTAITTTQQAAQTLAPWLNEAQQKLVRDSFLNGASNEEAGVLMEAARLLGLNPLLNQIHFVKRWDGRKKCDVWRFQVGIDGFRSIAEETGEYDGQDEPVFQEGKDHPTLCKVSVYRKGIGSPFVGVAYWDEYVQLTKEGPPNSMWQRGKHFMLSKCAEAVALRKAFPRKLSGVYIPEEMGTEVEVNAAPAPPVAQPKAQTERVKQQLKAKVVDVEPGETEETAEARAREPGSDDEPGTDVKVTFGTCKDMAVSALPDRNLSWYVNTLEREQPNWEPRWREKNQTLLDALHAEVERRTAKP